MRISLLAYYCYALDCLRQISIDRIIDFVKNFYDDYNSLTVLPPELDDIDVKSSMRELFEEFGIDGDSYLSHDEFLKSKYLDKEYIKTLLNEKQYKDYLIDIESK